MAKDQRNFFAEKKPWSEVKDDLLACYLTAYFQKILTTGRPVRYIDCFAGRGDFDDGKPGSPIIALRTAAQALNQGRSANTDLRMVFIESVHASALGALLDGEKNPGNSMIPWAIVDGKFECELPGILSSMRGCNVFAYIDPYGLRQLDFGLISGLADRRHRFGSIEILLNLNSFGLVREGCRVLKVQYESDPALAGEDEEFSDELDSSSSQNGGLLDSVMGGANWQQIIDDYRTGSISGYVAEQRFADLYHDKLMESFKYVLSMPIRKARGQQPKYRLVYATNHRDGCILMASNMLKRSENLFIYLPGHRQQPLFDLSSDGELCDSDYVVDQLREVIIQFPSFTDAADIEAHFYSTKGLICDRKAVRTAWRELAESGALEVRREPDITKNGTPAQYWSSSRDRTLLLRSASARA